MTEKIECNQIDLLGVFSYYWIPLAMFGSGVIIVFTGIIEPTSWGIMLMILSGVTAFVWTAFRGLF